MAATDAVTPKRRDSWADLMPARNIHDFSMDSMAETPSRMTMGFDNHSELRLKRVSRTPLNLSVLSNVTSIEQNETGIENKVNEPKDSKAQNVKRVQLSDRDDFNDLQKIQEETTETDATTSQLEVKNPLGEHEGNVLRGRKRRSTFFDKFSMNLTGETNRVKFIEHLLLQ